MFSIPALAEENVNFQTLHDMSDEILVFDDYYNSYIPLINKKSNKYLSSHIWIDVQKYKGNFLEFYSSEGLAIFFNGKFYKKFKKNGIQRIPINDINFNDNQERNVFVTFYHSNLYWDKNVKIAVPVTVNNSFNINDLQLLVKKVNPFKDYFITCFLLVTTLIAILKNYFTKSFYSFYSFLNYFRKNTDIEDDDTILSNVINKETITFIFVNSLILSYSILNLFVSFNQELINQLFNGFNYWQIFFIQSLFFMFMYFVKYLIIYFNALVYNLETYAQYHFYVFASFFQKIALFIFLISVLFSNHYSIFFVPFDKNFLNFNFVILLFIFVFFVFYKLRHLHKFTNFYLFSYLCITEALPILLFYRFYVAS